MQVCFPGVGARNINCTEIFTFTQGNLQYLNESSLFIIVELIRLQYYRNVTFPNFLLIDMSSYICGPTTRGCPFYEATISENILAWNMIKHNRH